jgi:hypothetical protein
MDRYYNQRNGLKQNSFSPECYGVTKGQLFCDNSDMSLRIETKNFITDKWDVIYDEAARRELERLALEPEECPVCNALVDPTEEEHCNNETDDCFTYYQFSCCNCEYQWYFSLDVKDVEAVFAEEERKRTEQHTIENLHVGRLIPISSPLDNSPHTKKNT